uniref:Uncharacterized protein n=1 Tax=Nelumbo nucifera TaxID=4432 RepID=A0A822YBQ4_NELNU|nr:TPA_asm: hypothetical protein HUJ06_028416 [Nelumbo nucifera]
MYTKSFFYQQKKRCTLNPSSSQQNLQVKTYANPQDPLTQSHKFIL